MRQRALLALSLLFGCGSSDDEDFTDADLQAALQGLRDSSAALCGKTDACYPEEAEADYCFVPVADGGSGLEREWPPAAADSCWEPLFAEHPGAVIQYLNCSQRTNQELADCLSGCPADASACLESSGFFEDTCDGPFLDSFSEQALSAAEECEEELAPGPD